jgi:predicted hotdog family 3-hydroxylacyl-ACP dehydratase
MRLIDWVKRPTPTGLQAGTVVTEEWPLYNNGAVSSILCIELVAQAIAALSTWRRGEGAGPRLGLLAGIKEAEISRSSVPLGTRLHIQIEELSHIGDYAVFEGSVRSDLDSFCKIIIQVMEPEEEFLANLKPRQRI